MASLEASFAERIGISQSALWILENNRRQTISRSYVLNIAKNLYCGSKVTLCLLACMARWLFMPPTWKRS
jgi:transcriptional regulator with XRE-family HTH domain